MSTNTATANRGRLTGDQFAETSDLTLEEVAARLTTDLTDIQGDEMLPADARFSVTADDAGDTPVLRVILTCDTGISDASSGIATQVFQLASLYNEVDLDQPGHARFVQHVHVKCGDSAEAVLVGAMVQT